MTAITRHDTKDPKGFLKEFFGFDTFKGNQEVVIQSIMDGKDCFVIMPTGAGKSMCYQLPAMMMEGTATMCRMIALTSNKKQNMTMNSVAAFSKRRSEALPDTDL